jgi:hypothetical protein
MEVQLHAFLTLTLGVGKRSASYHDHFTPGEKAPATHWIGGWVWPLKPVWMLSREKSPARQEFNPDSSVIQAFTWSQSQLSSASSYSGL